ncbi:MAG: hypothetical protein ACI9U2_000860 [Bradymonadia bacterium]
MDDAATKETLMTRSMIKTVNLLFLTLGLTALLAPAAFAQDGPGGLLEGDLLEEKKPAEKPMLDDPDLKLNKAVQTARTLLEKRLNPLQEKVVEFPKIDAKMQKIMGLWLKAMDGFFAKHGKALDAYRVAITASQDSEKTKQGKAVVKLRTALLKSIRTINKKVDNLEKALAKAVGKAEKE